MTPEDVITSIIYPKVFEEYMDFLKEYGWKVSWLSTEVFFSGMVIGQLVNVDLPDGSGNHDSLVSTHYTTFGIYIFSHNFLNSISRSKSLKNYGDLKFQ
jgi:hypothetical protein